MGAAARPYGPGLTDKETPCRNNFSRVVQLGSMRHQTLFHTFFANVLDAVLAPASFGFAWGLEELALPAPARRRRWNGVAPGFPWSRADRIINLSRAVSSEALEATYGVRRESGARALRLGDTAAAIPPSWRGRRLQETCFSSKFGVNLDSSRDIHIILSHNRLILGANPPGFRVFA